MPCGGGIPDPGEGLAGEVGDGPEDPPRTGSGLLGLLKPGVLEAGTCPLRALWLPRRLEGTAGL